jgi:hypothetical protein
MRRSFDVEESLTFGDYPRPQREDARVAVESFGNQVNATVSILRGACHTIVTRSMS